MTEQEQLTKQSITDDLLAEKSLWQVYLRSRIIPFSRENQVAGLLIFSATSFVTSYSDNLPIVLDQTLAVASLAFNTTISLLGFLLAGFTFFATVADKSLFCKMAETKDDKTGLSYLKLNLFVFMRVFVEYLIVCLLSLLIMVCLTEKSASRSLIEEQISHATILGNPRSPIWVASVGFGFFLGVFVYILAQLKSFIFNIYHVVVTSVSWSVRSQNDNE